MNPSEFRTIPLPPRRAVDSIMAARRADSFGKRSIKTSSKDYALRLAVTMTDLTTLAGTDSPEKVRSLCRKAISPAPALSRALEVSPPVISKIRHRRLPVTASLLIRMHEVSALSITELRQLMGDRRSKFRMSDKHFKPKNPV